MVVRHLVVVLSLMLCFTGIGAIFWQQELQYVKPTPVPDNYLPVGLGEQVLAYGTVTRPVFYHFFNPECPCSKFNLKHFNKLSAEYGQSIHMVAIIPEYADKDKAKNMVGDQVEVMADKQMALANALGVYATPQAVIVDQDGSLYYRGNYNKSRYCTTVSSNYAELALKAFLQEKPLPVFEPEAFVAYGCSVEEENRFSLFNF